MPLYNRDFGMGIVTAVNWFWNFFIAITLPKFLTAFTASGAFGWHAAWCVIGWWMVSTPDFLNGLRLADSTLCH